MSCRQFSQQNVLPRSRKGLAEADLANNGKVPALVNFDNDRDGTIQETAN